MKLLIDVTSYKSKSIRINGFNKPATVGLKIPNPLVIIPHACFKDYEKTKELSKQLKLELREYFNKTIKDNKENGLILRRGFYVPGIKYPPGPRTGQIKTVKQLFKEVTIFYEFALNNKFNIKGADIALALHPYIHPYLPPLQVLPEVPTPGGCITPSNNEDGHVIIETIWGHDEAVQSLPHDTYIVDYENMIIIDKHIELKKTALKAGISSKYDEIKIPPSHQNVQILNDLQILTMASHYKTVCDKYGKHRLEFLLQNNAPIYIECSAFAYEEEGNIDIFNNILGSIKVISKFDDIAELKDSDIIFIHPKVIKDRNMDLLTSLALSSKRKMTILYPGTATTAHAATIFREKGHLLVYTRNEIFNNNDKVEIKIIGGELKVKILDRSNIPNIITSKDTNFHKPEHIGYKAHRLFELQGHNVNVPFSIVVGTEVFKAELANNGIDTLVKKLNIEETNINDFRSITEQIRQAILNINISENLLNVIAKNLETTNIKSFSVRSSSNAEDLDQASFAGQFDTILNVRTKDLEKAIKQVWASVFKFGTISYARSYDIDINSIDMAVIIQTMLQPSKAGVLFTKDVENHSNNTIVEAVKGVGDKVVDGVGEIEKIMIRNSLEIERFGPIILKDKDINKLVESSNFIEKLYSKPQDIEWAIEDDKLVILQTRPITI